MSPGASRNSVRSWPTQNPRPAPVTTTARTSSSRAAALSAAWSSRCIAASNAFSTSGRLRTIVWTAPSRELSVQVDYRRGLARREHAVEARDLAPVRLRRGVQRRDRGLQLVRPGAAATERPVEHAPSLLDPGGVPERAVLLLEEHELGPGPRGAAGVLEQHQREQAERLRLVRHEHSEEPAEPDRLVAE